MNACGDERPGAFAHCLEHTRGPTDTYVKRLHSRSSRVRGFDHIFKRNARVLRGRFKKHLWVTRKTKRNAAKVNATLRFILQILFKTVAVTFARRRF